MPNCPRCVSEIDHLMMYVMREESRKVELNVTGGLKVGVAEEELSMMYIEYDCPKCDEMVCRGESNAQEFLTGGRLENS